MDPSRPSLDVIYHGPIPDLLQNEAQAIITGEVLASGVFEADEILLKCPTKYEGSVPDQIETE
jgi:cytochrome c-type biogenesis protein CcmE